MLQDIDAARTRGLRDEELNQRLSQTVDKYLPLRVANEEDVRKDVVSNISPLLTGSVLINIGITFCTEVSLLSQSARPSMVCESGKELAQI